MTSEELEALAQQFLERGGAITAAAPSDPELPRWLLDPELAAAVRQRAEAGDGICAAAKALRRNTRTINAIARQHGIAFPARNSTAGRATAAALRRSLAPRVQRMANRGLTQAEIAEQLGITRATLRTLAREHAITINSRAR